MKANRVINKLVRFAGLACLGENLKALDSDCQPSPARRASTARIIVLGRQHYFETRKTYPVHTLKELRSAIKLDAGELSPWPAAQPLYQVVSHKPGKMRVNLWFPNPAVEQQLAKAWLIIPESLLLARASGHNLLYLDTSQPWFLYQAQNGLITSQQAKGLYSDRNVFAGLTPLGAEQMRTISEPSVGSLYLQGLHTLRPRDLVGLLTVHHWVALPDAIRLKKLGAMTAALFVAYTAGSSVWLVYSKNQLEETVSATRASTDAQLALESELEQMAARYTELKGALSSSTNSALALAVYPHFSEQISELQRLVLSEQQVELSVVTPSATNLLESLSENPAITRPRFSGPVQGNTRGSGDRATLVFGFTPGVQSLAQPVNRGEAGNG